MEDICAELKAENQRHWQILASSTLKMEHIYAELKAENQRLKEENQSLKGENQNLKEENQHYKNLLKKDFKNAGTSLLGSNKTSEACYIDVDCDNLNAADVTQQFYEYFNKIEVELPKKLGMDRLHLWKFFCKLFQTSFQCCREEIVTILIEPLYSLTELSEDEDFISRVNCDRYRELADVINGYRYLQRYSLPKLKKLRFAILERVKNAIVADADEAILPLLDDQLLKATEICWRMQMLPTGTPMFVCQPKFLNENWHDIHRSSWDYDAQMYELVYYRPVLMNGVGGAVAHKGFVGNDTGVAHDVSLASSHKFQDVSCKGCQTAVPLEKATVIDDAHWHHHCLTKYRCAKCTLIISRQEIRTCPKEQNYFYHHDCYICNVCKQKAEKFVVATKSLMCRKCYNSCLRCKRKLDHKFRVSADITICSKCYGLITVNKCFKCEATVRTMDRLTCPGGIVYHTRCMNCEVCGKSPVFPESSKYLGYLKFTHWNCKS